MVNADCSHDLLEIQFFFLIENEKIKCSFIQALNRNADLFQQSFCIFFSSNKIWCIFSQKYFFNSNITQLTSIKQQSKIQLILLY